MLLAVVALTNIINNKIMSKKLIKRKKALEFFEVYTKNQRILKQKVFIADAMILWHEHLLKENKLQPIELELAFRMVGMIFDIKTVTKIIDIVKLIESKGEKVDLKDIVLLQESWLEDWQKNK